MDTVESVNDCNKFLNEMVTKLSQPITSLEDYQDTFQILCDIDEPAELIDVCRYEISISSIMQNNFDLIESNMPWNEKIYYVAMLHLTAFIELTAFYNEEEVVNKHINEISMSWLDNFDMVKIPYEVNEDFESDKQKYLAVTIFFIDSILGYVDPKVEADNGYDSVELLGMAQYLDACLETISHVYAPPESQH